MVANFSIADTSIVYENFASDDDYRFAREAFGTAVQFPGFILNRLRINPGEAHHELFLYYFPEGQQTPVSNIFKRITNQGTGNFFNQVRLLGRPPAADSGASKYQIEACNSPSSPNLRTGAVTFAYDTFSPFIILCPDFYKKPELTSVRCPSLPSVMGDGMITTGHLLYHELM